MPSIKSIWLWPWTKLGLTRELLIAVFKNALPSTAALWIIQSTSVGQSFDTVGFLPIIVTILMAPSQPRVPYLRLLFFTVFLNCIVLCVTLLAGFCSTQARLHTTPPDGRIDAYNSSAAAVSGVWLIAVTWGLQTYRTFNPHRAKSVILCTIYTLVSVITSTTLADMPTVITFEIELFEMFLLGYAFSAASSLFIFPQSSRDVTRSDIAKLFDLSKKSTLFETPYGDPTKFEGSNIPNALASGDIAALSRTFAKFQLDISDAKKDFGISQISSNEYKEIVYHLQTFIIPLRGLFAVEGIRTMLGFGPQSSNFDRENALDDPIDIDTKERWDSIFEKIQLPMSALHGLTEQAIEHCRVCLNLAKRKPTRKDSGQDNTKTNHHDSEKASDELPGGVSFVSSFEKQIDQRRVALQLLLISLKDEDGQLGSVVHVDAERPPHKQHSPTAAQGRLLFTLYIEHLYNGILDALQELVVLFDTKYMHSKPQLQLPGRRKLMKTLKRLSDHHHVEGDLDDITSEIPNLTPQRSRKPVKDKGAHQSSPTLERLSSYLNKPFEIVGSPQSFFGLRVACAVMSVAIVGLLAQTQQWFFNWRGIWGAVFIPFSMAPSSGEAKSMLFYRVLGTLCSIPVSLVNWYIVDGVPAGVIVVYFVLIFVQQYFIVKYPQWGSFWRPCLITHSIIVGYSVQAQHTHVPQPPATVTNDFPIYLIGPYRGLCTLVGVAVAYVWTVFPQPTTANSVMRRRLGQALFSLAEYHSCMHHAISSWAGGRQGDMLDKYSPSHQLMRARHRLFVKETATLAVIRDQHKFAGFDLSFAGRGPEHRYVTMADEIDRIMSYLNVVIFVSAHFQSHLNRRSKSIKIEGPWEAGVSDLLVACKSVTSHVASLIHILASSVTNDQPLPPFLETPEPFVVARKLRKMRPDLMNIEHAGEEGYKAFAVIEVSVAMMAKSLDRILVIVRDLVGEVGIGVDLDVKKHK